MTPSELKYNIEAKSDSKLFFSRSTMKFFGDTMANYGCHSGTVNGKEAWVLTRKKAVKHGLNADAYFCKETFNRIFKRD